MREKEVQGRTHLVFNENSKTLAYKQIIMLEISLDWLKPDFSLVKKLAIASLLPFYFLLLLLFSYVD